ncbi:MAG: helix-turn-helix transcriptional regulator [Clostridiales bacterium]|nr:helix-turn-helix transcriptional regulator [Clostridiales bacterium]
MNAGFRVKEKCAVTDALRQILANNLKSARKERGLTQEALGDLSGISVNQIAQIERAALNVRLDALAALADGLELDLRQLLAPPERGKR